MLNGKLPIEKIMLYSGLTEKQILNIKNNLINEELVTSVEKEKNERIEKNKSKINEVKNNNFKAKNKINQDIRKPPSPSHLSKAGGIFLFIICYSISGRHSNPSFAVLITSLKHFSTILST